MKENIKILVINNHSIHIKEILNKFDSTYSINFENLKDINYEDYDAVILSGGSSLSVINHEKEYKKELELIKNFEGPIL